MPAPSTKSDLLDRAKALAANHGSSGINYVCGDLEAALEVVIDLLPEDLVSEAWTEICERLVERQGIDDQEYQTWESRYERKLDRSH